ncbi:uncharacterized protein LOC119078901 [Bradysia coprophila]|uniref:uncharacterized protein LOC119078901 n=1 Tax=Bradysia coprophila TaxID=38358 RepID=UPI00187DAF48|nr:uncharacterized protein LOC119078901 [Bradysia coprophila]
MELETSFITSRFTMEDVILRFLNEIGAWKEIEPLFDEYLTNVDEKDKEFVSSSVVLPLKYEYSMFRNDFESLGQFLIANPHYYEHVLRKVILKAVNSELENMSRPFRVQDEQIHFVYRLEKLPLVDKYKFYPSIRMSLSNFTCIVAGRGEVTKYTRQTVWHCNRKCIPNVVSKAAPTCELCHKTMIERVPLRDMSEQVKLIVFPLEMAQTPRRSTGTMYQKFDVILRDDLAAYKVIYGNAYVITGIYDAFGRVFNAWNIVECADV